MMWMNGMNIMAIKMKVRMTLLITDGSPQCLMMNSTIGGKSVSGLDAGLHLTRTKLPDGTTALPHRVGSKANLAGATIHMLAVTHGDLALYKLHVHVFSGKTNKDLGQRNNHTISIQKWVNLLSLMIDDFKGNGH